MAAVLSPTSALSHTYFPPTFEMLKAIRELKELEEDYDFALGGTRIRTHALRHPGGCLAYRLDAAGRSFVFATDHEQPEVPDRGLAAFAHGADLLYTEGQYTQAEYDGREPVPGDTAMARRGWGHSPVEACVRTALAARVRRLHVGHHDPARGDEHLAYVERYCQQLARDELRQAGRPEDDCAVSVPHEGLTVELP
jgi:ribonuclease BN (tRNA processing enzyme)